MDLSVGIEGVEAWKSNPFICSSVLSLSADLAFLAHIKEGYRSDPFVKKLVEGGSLVPRITRTNGLWFFDGRLIIPEYLSLREDLFHLAHDTCGHFGADKSYAMLADSYYWPNMRRDLCKHYVPGCEDCQRNKGRTAKNGKGPLHPLPVPESRCGSVAMDFIGLLLLDQGYDCILTMTDRLGSDLKIIPTNVDITAPTLARLVFDTWYCDNGLPLEWVSDRDKLFISEFWSVLNKLSGVKIKMSSSFHPETDGSSERSNKTVNQAVRFYVERNQIGWVNALPKIRFDIMNSVNASTGLSMFQLRYGRSPRILPPIVPVHEFKKSNLSENAANVHSFLTNMACTVREARDNLALAKVVQAYQADKNCGPCELFKAGDLVMLSTWHRREIFKKSGEKRVAKFFPRFDGPYEVLKAYPETSHYTLDMPNHPNVFPSFYVDQLKRYVANKADLFPGREHNIPTPTIVDGYEEFEIDRIIDSRRRGRGWKFLVRWVDQSPSEDCWLSYSSLHNCSALDDWVRNGGDGPPDLLNSVDL